MLLESITLKNYRQYFGEQVIEFSKSTNRNITVIHGENGSGKTALLNAFNWCLYGKLNLPNEENIINEHAIDIAGEGEEVEGFVSLNFLDRGKKYELTRRIVATKNGGNVYYKETEVSMDYMINGQSESIENPTVEINRILPENLRTYFFFDGERIDNLSKEEGSYEIKDAIKSIMGLEILERAISHTEAARKRFRNEMKRYGDPETRDLIEGLEKLEHQKEELVNGNEIQIENLKAVSKQIKDVELRLKQIEGSKQLQELRDKKSEELMDIRERIKKSRKSLSEYISKNGYLAFSYPVISKAEETIMKVGDNPKNVITGIKATFIDELLEKGLCICGTELTNGSEHYEHVERVKEHLAPKSLDHAISQFKGDLRVMKDRKKILFEHLKDLKGQELANIQREKKLVEEIEEIGMKISEKDSEEIVTLEDKRNQLVEQKSKIDRLIGKNQAEIEIVDQQIKDKEKERSKLITIADKAKLTQRRIDVCQELEVAMAEIFNVREKLVKINLQDRISSVYSSFLRKDYKIKLSENYELNVLNQNGKPVGMSQGERQITSLSFIGSIVDIAREQYKGEEKSNLEEGGIYPLVMDSPFGALDSDHRERVAKGIYKLADQVIVIVSTSQWKGEVEKQMTDLIGKEYKLNYNDPRQNKEKPYEFTEVVEVE